MAVLSEYVDYSLKLQYLKSIFIIVSGSWVISKPVTYTDCSVTSVGHACLFSAYSYMLVLILLLQYAKTCTIAKCLRIILKVVDIEPKVSLTT